MEGQHIQTLPSWVQVGKLSQDERWGWGGELSALTLPSSFWLLPRNILESLGPAEHSYRRGQSLPC